MEKGIKYRHELKYRCSEKQISVLSSRLSCLLTLDPHVENGQYNIRSMYFDSYNNRCYYENENGTNLREKYRIRIYNHSSQRITLECKKKENGMTHKSSCLLTLDEYNKILTGTSFDDLATKPYLLQKICSLQYTQLFRPSIIVDYDRIPYICEDGNVRITIDKNISSSTDFGNFFSDDLHVRPLQQQNQHLLEVKYDEFLPDYIKTALELDDMQQITFSKFYLCKKFSIGGLL